MNRIWHGWGIHWWFGTWVFNVSGWQAVEIVYANGKRYRIGSDQPEALAAAIRAVKQ